MVRHRTFQLRHRGPSGDVDASFGLYLLITESVGGIPMTVRLWVNRNGLIRPVGQPRLSLALNPSTSQDQSYCVNLVRGDLDVCVRCTSIDDPVFDVRVRGSEPIDFNLTTIANAQLAKATVVPVVTFDASPGNDCLNELYDPGTHWFTWGSVSAIDNECAQLGVCVGPCLILGRESFFRATARQLELNKVNLQLKGQLSLGDGLTFVESYEVTLVCFRAAVDDADGEAKYAIEARFADLQHHVNATYMITEHAGGSEEEYCVVTFWMKLCLEYWGLGSRKEVLLAIEIGGRREALPLVSVDTEILKLSDVFADRTEKGEAVGETFEIADLLEEVRKRAR